MCTATLRPPLRLSCLQLGRKLIQVYDKNGDGVLQPSEFAPREDMRIRLEALFDERIQVRTQQLQV